MSALANNIFSSVERGLLPDALIRAGIRRLCRERLQEIATDNAEQANERLFALVGQMRQATIALVPELANKQHYEVPAEFFHLCLGPHRKYSSAYFAEGVTDLAVAEHEALKQTCEHAELADGQTILELGCGWGSLTLWMAEHYPNSKIVAVSNSFSQRDFIAREAAARGLKNIEQHVADMNNFDIALRFDRVVSVEMFEHMRNWSVLLNKIAGWLKPGGKLMIHIFCHRSTPYLFEDRDESDWMSRYFFSGGMMPSDDLPLLFQQDLSIVRRWRWDGAHYQKTANAWLKNLDSNRTAAIPILKAVYGDDAASIWLQRWRIFFMACAELFGFNNGQEWRVSHYLFERPRS
ncbi:MAG: cyclopropane-fatty-acyl-phospholipid synthase family protein [Steroidobacter sp.]